MPARNVSARKFSGFNPPKRQHALTPSANNQPVMVKDVGSQSPAGARSIPTGARVTSVPGITSLNLPKGQAATEEWCKHWVKGTKSQSPAGASFNETLSVTSKTDGFGVSIPRWGELQRQER